MDASYLSPNVNMSARLEAATKQFGTPLLLSEDFVTILSKKSSQHVRQIDAVTVKGSTRPIGLFTVDTNTEDIHPEPEVPSASIGVNDMTDEFLEHPDINSAMGGCHSSEAEFTDTFNKGFLAYKAGDWGTARTHLEKTVALHNAGSRALVGPTNCLLGVLAANNYTAPAGWRGFRELTEK